MKHRIAIIAICLLWININVWADVHLTVMDDSRDPVVGATVAACDTTSNRIIEITLTDENGKASMQTDLDAGSAIGISAPGYKSLTMAYDPSQTTIVLEREASDLQEVTVYATKDNIKQSGGTLMFAPGSLKKEVANIYDLIKYVPMVHHENGEFKLIGRSNPPIIKVNGEIPRDMGPGFLEALKSFPATMVRRVEVSPNAGSGESAAFDGGVINLVVDMPDEGVLNRIGADVGYHTDFSTSESYWLGWKKKRLRGSANFGFSNRAEHNESVGRYDFLDRDKTVSENVFSKSSRQSLNGSVNLSYVLSKRSVVGAGVGIQTGHEWRSEYTEGMTRAEGTDTPTRFLSQNRQPWYAPSYGVSAWYTANPVPNKNMLDIYAGYSHNAPSSYNTYEEWNPDGVSSETRQDMSLNVHGYAFKATFTQVVKGRHQLTGGYMVYGIDVEQGETYPGLDDDEFHYKDMTNSLFCEWGAMWSGIFSTRVGLRGEYLHMNGSQVQDFQSFSKDYWNLFPTASVSLNIPKGSQSLSLNVGRSIDIPLYTMLNPYRKWTSASTYYVGNPDLRPSYGWNTELTYSFLSNWLAAASWHHEPHIRENYTYAKDGYTVSSSANIGNYDSYTVLLQFFKSFWQKLRVNASASLYHIVRDGVIEGAYLQRRTTYFSGSLRLNYLISERHQWRASAVVRYSSPDPGLTNNGRPNYNLTAEVSKEWKCGLSLKAECRDLIIQRSPLTFENDTYRSYHKIVHRPIRIALSASYTFGNLRVQSADDRQMKIK